MKAEEAALQARLDSIRRVEDKIVSDSLSALDSLTARGVVMSDHIIAHLAWLVKGKPLF